MTSKGKNAMDRKSKELEDNVLSDSDCSEPDLECDPCGMIFTNAKSYASHLQGKKHQKKLSEAKLLAKNFALDKNDGESDDDEDEDSKQIHCDVCDKDISGYKSYALHLKGSVHAKNIKKQKLKKSLASMPEVLDKGNEENASDDDECVMKPYARCTPCQKEFSGPEPFILHTKSAAHKKKVKQAQISQNLKEKYDDGTKKSDDEEFFSKCDVCQKSFSGMIPYHIHMESSAHKKSLEKKKVAEEIKEFSLNGDVTNGYVCKDCKKIFKDPLAFKSHLANNSHEKLKAKNALVEFLSLHPEIVFVTPLNQGDSDDSDESDTTYYLICKVCNMSFSGPESAQDHVRSKKHISSKKENKLIKLLKEQKLTPSVNTNDKNGTVKSPDSSRKEVPEKGNDKVSEKSVNLEEFELV